MLWGLITPHIAAEHGRSVLPDYAGEAVVPSPARVCGHVQGFGLKATATFYVRFINSPVFIGGVDMGLPEELSEQERRHLDERRALPLQALLDLRDAGETPALQEQDAKLPDLRLPLTGDSAGP